MKQLPSFVYALAACLGTLAALAEPAKANFHQKSHWRQPMALVAAGDRIYAANQRSGTISVLSLDLKVLAEPAIEGGGKLSDLAVMHAGGTLVAVDEENHQLLVLKPQPNGVVIRQRLDVAKTPVGVAVDATGTRCAVASLWSRRVTLFQTERTHGNGRQLAVQAVLDLPFSPRKMIWLEKQKRLVAADSFGGRLGIIDPDAARLVSVKTVAGHNIRGLALSRDGRDLLISQQVLDASSTTTHSPVFWGELMQNVLRSQLLEEVLSVTPKAEHNGDLFRTEPLGHPSNATGDPHDVRVLPGGQTAVSLSGVGEIAIRRTDLQPFERFDAQAHSTALLLHPDGRRLLVANTFADSITIFDLEKWGIAGHVSLGPTPALNEWQTGERLFYDAKLSLDGWYSCHSCHTDGHTTGQRNDNLSDSSYGAPKRILPLGGVAETGPWAWNAQAKDLKSQLHSSIQNTMQGKPRSDEELSALVAYLQTLEPAPSLDVMRGTIDEKAVARGENVFHAQGCAECHQPPTFTSPQTYDVGFKDEIGEKKFNPPSLRGVSQRLELFHDGRAKSLSDVLQKFRHGEAQELGNQDRADLIAFLRSL